jgi:hypothetical protein
MRDVRQRQRSVKAVASFKHSQSKSGLTVRSFAVLVSAWQDTRDYFTDSYRPELYYMRGPGPKWQAKYGHLSREADAL